MVATPVARSSAKRKPTGAMGAAGAAVIDGPSGPCGAGRGRRRAGAGVARDERLAQAPEQPPELAPLRGVERREQLRHVRGVHRDEPLHEVAPLAGEEHARQPPVARIGAALDHAVALGAVDEAREVARRDEHAAAQRRERLPVLAVEVGEQIEARHRAVGGEAAAHLAEHEVVRIQQAHPEADADRRDVVGISRGSGRGLHRPSPGGGATEPPSSGRTAIPSISTRAPGSSSPATFTRLIAGQ